MKVNPLIHFGDNFCRCLAINYSVKYADGAGIISVFKMNMWRIMILPI